MPPAPAEIMPPPVFQLQHVQHIQKAFYVCPSLSVAVVGLGVPVLQPPPCGGGIRSRAIFSGDIRATLPFFGVRSEFVGVILSLFALGSFSVCSFFHGFITGSL